ncbi:hypothetical protein BDR07DRAFT_1373853 [Suillus spraguei]|nr:hypothetical protein BDR07DRAFT_1373853 [Suillus spraguei]
MSLDTQCWRVKSPGCLLFSLCTTTDTGSPDGKLIMAQDLARCPHVYPAHDELVLGATACIAAIIRTRWIDEYGPLVTITIRSGTQTIVIIGRYKAMVDIMEKHGD